MTKMLKIDVFTDVVCPWCAVGSARLDAAIVALPDDVKVVVENPLPSISIPIRPPKA
ncbi:MAG: DsbA family protein [Candidatus Devosia symbiotica]|nr:DsbA family protein [Candidatus Devosia symbiotica]